MKFENGIELRDHTNGLLVSQYDDAYVARNWRLTSQTVGLVQTALNSDLRWMIRDGMPQASALWPNKRGRVYLAFSPTRENQWYMAIDTPRKQGGYGHAVFNGKYLYQFEKHKVGFEFEKRNTKAKHLVVPSHRVLSTLKLIGKFDHSVLYMNRSSTPVQGFSTEYDIQRTLLLDWRRTPFAKQYELVTDEYPVDGGRNSRRIDILARSKSKIGHLVIEIKRAQADGDAVKQLREYVKILRSRSGFSGKRVSGALVAERIPTEVRSALQRAGFSGYEVSYPRKFNAVC